MSENNDAEYSELASAVARVEKLIAEGGQNVGHLLKAFVENAKSRLEDLKFDERRQESSAKEEKERKNSAIAAAVEREHRLNAEEKAQYSEFLEKDWFTKNDFDRLNSFYANTWDKLSSEGKSEMSHRVWEGIRQGEYSFEELPETVKKKEAEWLHSQLTGVEPASPGLENLPQKEREEFIRAYEAGDEKKVSEVLSSRTASQHVSNATSVESESVKVISPEKSVSDESIEQSIQDGESLVAAFPHESQPIDPTSLPQSGGHRVR